MFDIEEENGRWIKRGNYDVEMGAFVFEFNFEKGRNRNFIQNKTIHQTKSKGKKIAYIMLSCVKFLMLWHPSLTG